MADKGDGPMIKQVLGLLRQFDYPLITNELVEKLSIPKNRLYPCLMRMEAAGLVKKSVCEDHARMVEWELTKPAGGFWEH